MIEPGQKAPTFSLPDQAGTVHTLDQFSGGPLVVYFYPKDDTPGCTKEACSFRDNWQALVDAGISVVGISADSVESHAAFAGKFSLPFPLLSDPEMEVIKAYGAYGEKNMYGKKFEGILRTTFLIDSDGVVTRVFKRPKSAIHAEEVLTALGGA